MRCSSRATSTRLRSFLELVLSPVVHTIRIPFFLPSRPIVHLRIGLGRHIFLRVQFFQCVSEDSYSRKPRSAELETNRCAKSSLWMQAVGGTSGIWAPSLRYHDGEFFISTTLVFDKMDINDTARWIMCVALPAWNHDTNSCTDHTPYHKSLRDGRVVRPSALQFRRIRYVAILGRGRDCIRSRLAPMGSEAPEGPHMHLKDDYYYLIIAEGGTGLNHMETAARSKEITGPFTPAPHNLLLTNPNTSAYFRFQGRETVLTNVAWAEGEWPGIIGGPILPQRLSIPGDGPWITAPHSIDFTPGSELPLHFAHWRLPDPAAYVISPPEHEFVYSVDMEYTPQVPEEEAGVSVFLT
ncbi:Glycoside hydrolase family 43 protein [Mycena sanguinolenta]|uniref:Glycoside hydrolase family 43 protein n=1 Tax=Mycena sanguinolenta TaxID=230812 RepID=A0A8H7D759_9AGAR|nr:Glycoside hydrolase family 43 protein [Mycena sanguinolenta]